MPQLLNIRGSSVACAVHRGWWHTLVLFGAILLLPPLAGSSAASLVRQPAPDFALRTIDGQNLRLSEHLGEVVLINFWATWCGPCRQEMPLLDELYAKYRRAGLVLLSVNIDEQEEPAVEMARTLKVSYPVLFDARKDVSRAYDVGTMPLTVLVDREGVVRYVSEGYKPGYEQRYTEKLRELLNE
jgi:thiol-disulfide isomerase/thioredoxin